MSSKVENTPLSKEVDALIGAMVQFARMGKAAEQKSPKVPETVQCKTGLEGQACANVSTSDESSREDFNSMDLHVTEAIVEVLEQYSQARQKFEHLMQMVKHKVIVLEHYNKELSSLFGVVDNYSLPIPKIWEHLAEIIEPTIDNNPESWSKLKEKLHPCIPSVSAGKMVSAILHCAAKRKGTSKVAELWKHSNLRWSDFLPPDENVSKFVQQEKLEFTLHPVESDGKMLMIADIRQKLQAFIAGSYNKGSLKSTEESTASHPKTVISAKDCCPNTNVPANGVTITEELKSFLHDAHNCQDICKWADVKIRSKKISECGFARALVTAVFENAIKSNPKFSEDSLGKVTDYLPLLRQYVATDDLQLEALHALQALMNRLENPEGILTTICEFLYDHDIICEEAFLKWEVDGNPAEKEGKDAVLSSVSSFLKWLREADEDTEDSIDQRSGKSSLSFPNEDNW